MAITRIWLEPDIDFQRYKPGAIAWIKDKAVRLSPQVLNQIKRSNITNLFQQLVSLQQWTVTEGQLIMGIPLAGQKSILIRGQVHFLTPEDPLYSFDAIAD